MGFFSSLLGTMERDVEHIASEVVEHLASEGVEHIASEVKALVEARHGAHPPVGDCQHAAKAKQTLRSAKHAFTPTKAHSPVMTCPLAEGRSANVASSQQAAVDPSQIKRLKEHLAPSPQANDCLATVFAMIGNWYADNGGNASSPFTPSNFEDSNGVATRANNVARWSVRLSTTLPLARYGGKYITTDTQLGVLNSQVFPAPSGLQGLSQFPCIVGGYLKGMEALNGNPPPKPNEQIPHFILAIGRDPKTGNVIANDPATGYQIELSNDGSVAGVIIPGESGLRIPSKRDGTRQIGTFQAYGTVGVVPMAVSATNSNTLLPIVSLPQSAQTPVSLNWDTPAAAYNSTRILAAREGLSNNEIDVLCACIYQESGFRTDAVHQNRDDKGALESTDYGIVQVNDRYHIGDGKDFPSTDYVLNNPEEDVQWMINLYKQGHLSWWASYSSGAYETWLKPNSPMWSL